MDQECCWSSYGVGWAGKTVAGVCLGLVLQKLGGIGEVEESADRID